MNKIILVLLITTFQITAFGATSPNEKQIFYHLHQATRWAELMYSKNCFFSEKKMQKHLGKIKYSNPRLVDSKFYQDYIFLRNIAFGISKSNFNRVESLREKIHSTADELKLKHPTNWQNEFLVCSKKI